MAKEVKVTKAQVLEAIIALAKGEEITVDTADIVEYAETTIAQLAAKAEKAKARAAEKKANGDELKTAVAAVLTDEYQTVEQIAAQIEGEDITNAKIVARLTALVKAGEAHKTDIKVDNKTRKAYAAGPATDTEDAE